MVEIFMSNCEDKDSPTYDEIILVYDNVIRYSENKNDFLIVPDEPRKSLVDNYFVKIGEYND